jgi:hypothetical protein
VFHIFLLKLISLKILSDLTLILKKEILKEEYEVKRIINVIKK